ncbi:MAG: cytochrome c, partial [Gammaproteobacteria bacterium]|nr:cytochrome c [Gammaproteobacteria bacterium]
DPSQQWQKINNQFGSQVLLNLSGDSTSSDKLVALNQYRKLIVSENAGKDWHNINGKYKPASDSEKRGQSLFKQKCQSCHGIEGVGETYNIQSLTDKSYIRAPALNASEHAWHHTDEALVKTIMEGSSRASRMPAWKNSGLSDENANDLVSYIKSLWTQRELDCQGPKHMQCM